MVEFEFDSKKFEQAILFYLSALNNGLLGKTKLFKLLYYADFDHFEKYGTPISGETYVRYEHGPFPQHGEGTLKKLQERETIRIEHVLVGNYLQFTFQPLVESDLAVFSSLELKTLIDVMQKWERHNAYEMVSATHGEAPWIATEPDKPISYSLSYYRNKFGEMNEFAEEDENFVNDIEEVG